MHNLPPNSRRCYQQEVAHSSFQPLDFTALPQQSLLWWVLRAHLGLPRLWCRTKSRSNQCPPKASTYILLLISVCRYLINPGAVQLSGDLSGLAMMLGISCGQDSRTPPASGVRGRQRNWLHWRSLTPASSFSWGSSAVTGTVLFCPSSTKTTKKKENSKYTRSE